MDLHLRIKSPHYEAGMPLDSVSDYLRGYKDVIQSSLEIASSKFGSKKARIEAPEIYINNLNHKCIDTSFTVDLAPVMAIMGPILPQMSVVPFADYAWQLIKKGTDVIQWAASVFKQEGKAPNMNVVNSPGAQVVAFVVGRDFSASSDLLSFLGKIAKPINHISERLEADDAESMRFDRVQDHRVVDSIQIGKAQVRDLRVISEDKKDDRPIDIDVHVYDLNVRTGCGMVEIKPDGGEPVRRINFRIENSQPISPYIDALRAKSSRMTAIRSYTETSLGERRITSLLAVGIVND